MHKKYFSLLKPYAHYSKFPPVGTIINRHSLTKDKCYEKADSYSSAFRFNGHIL